jgi:hypothetical protein
MSYPFPTPVTMYDRRFYLYYYVALINSRVERGIFTHELIEVWTNTKVLASA